MILIHNLFLAYSTLTTELMRLLFEYRSNFLLIPIQTEQSCDSKNCVIQAVEESLYRQSHNRHNRCTKFLSKLKMFE